MTSTPRYLTKSRFKLALTCPTKLYYSGKPDYLNTSSENSFLRALAEGGHQVGALACLMYPGGVEVTDTLHAAQLERTRELLLRDEVTIYEAAFEAEGLFVRVDVLRKRGNAVELVEVKAKSYHPAKHGDFRNAKGALLPTFLPYLQDIAFQKHVVAKACPDLALHSCLMLVDTSRVATVDSLNQRFRILRDGTRVRVSHDPTLQLSDLGEPILTAIPVDDQVAQILAGTLTTATGERPFDEVVHELASAYRGDDRIAPVPGSHCRACEFKASAPPPPGALRSGFHECWEQVLSWRDADFAGGTVLDIWNFRRKDELFSRGVLRLAEVTAADLGFDGSEPGELGMRAAHRQWYQCSGSWPGDGQDYLNRGGMLEEMRSWRYPLHFIDFETSAVPIPFAAGQRPYETTAFQFSHHVLHEDGRLAHQTQFLDATPGRCPNLNFMRALHLALSSDDGTVFRWATHENTVLNHLRRQLLTQLPAAPDRETLVAFIDSLTTRKDGDTQHVGARSMVDLCDLAERHYFHPSTAGSSSLKKVLPALMASSAFLRARYGRPVYGTPEMPSCNPGEPKAWWQERDGLVCDPYDLLPPVFDDVDVGEQLAAEVGIDPSLQQGGTAMAAYARLQFEELAPGRRAAIESALLRYCELDTLAMVMAVQAWQHHPSMSNGDRHP